MINLTENIKEIIDNTPLAVVKFESDTCQVCKNIAPILLDAEKMDLYSGIDFYTVNLDTNYEEANTFNIRSLPTLLFAEYGDIIHRHKGLITKDQLHVALNELLEQREH